MAGLIADPFRAARLILALRQAGVTNSPVLKAMETLDRGSFIPDEYGDLAFENVHIPIDCGQTVPPGALIGQLLAAVRFTDTREGRTLIVGAGSGYACAIAASLSAHVVAAERYRTLAETARTRLAALHLRNVDVYHADGLTGLAEYGPYDRIVLMGLVDELPDRLVSVLTRGGRMAAPMMRDEGDVIAVIDAAGNELSADPVMDGLVPLRSGVARSL